MAKIIVENTFTGERYVVAEFNALGDAMTCFRALSEVSPNHLNYQIQPRFQVN